MTVLSVVQAASLPIGVAVPSQLFAGTTRVLKELQVAVNRAAAMIAFDCGHDWTALKTLGVLNGDGVKLAFDRPADYERMLKKARLWPSATPYAPFTHITDTDAWLGMQVQAFQPVVGAWTMISDQIHVRVGGSNTPLGAGATAQFYYVTTNFAKKSDGTQLAAFSADDDRFRLDERLLELALIYRWKQSKGQDYAEEMGDYQDALAIKIGADKGSAILSIGRPSTGMDADYASPGVIGS